MEKAQSAILQILLRMTPAGPAAVADHQQLLRNQQLTSRRDYNVDTILYVPRDQDYHKQLSQISVRCSFFQINSSCRCHGKKSYGTDKRAPPNRRPSSASLIQPTSFKQPKP